MISPLSVVLLSALALLPPPSVDIDAYVIEPGLEMALARSAAPSHISDFATVMVLTPAGYEVVHEGSNGFTCLVVRSFGGPGRELDPRVRAPMCLTEGARDGALAAILHITDGVVAGRPMPEILESLDGALADGSIARAEPGDLAYMLSGEQWLNERVGRWLPHLMFFMTDVTHAELGGNPFGSNWPVVIGGTTGDFGDVTVALDADDFLSMHHFDRELLEHPSRPDADRQQDAGRRALTVYEWLGIRPGMAVADVFSAGGYNTHLLSLALGSSAESRVYAVLGSIADDVQELIGLDSAASAAERIATGDLDNVTVVATLSDLPAGGLDAIVSIRNFHDIDFFGGDSATAAAAMYRALKPGGVMGIEEVATDRPGWDEATHRLNETVVVETLTRAGFEVAGRSRLLRNPDDDHSTPGFGDRHDMDRYLLKFRKPRG